MFSADELIDCLGYGSSKNFLRRAEFDSVPTFSHVFRLAAEDCGLVGVYVLQRQWGEPDQSAVPVVYVCEARNIAEADTFHRLVWNQNVVPFVIVRTPSELRLYSGFSYRAEASPTAKRGAAEVLRETVFAADLVSRVIPSFHAENIDNGMIWNREARYVRPEAKVDWHLLENLQSLGFVLRERMGLSPGAAHALIGKFVYLRYLRDRNILSNRRLAEFRITEDQVFSRRATLSAVKTLIESLDEWLNGSVFDIPWGSGIRAEHVREVAGAFFGDDPETHQLNLFEDYDFSHIPVETLSVVYEQFLHAEGKAKNAGAYYTPIPLVDFVLNSLEELRPLELGMRVLDPACGSGAFLVQAYRRLVEKQRKLRPNHKLSPVELRSLLCEHFYGTDRDEDACQVTELSLIITLLGYVSPPDLTRTNFKLPVLRNNNIFAGEDDGDFFNTESTFHSKLGYGIFDWIVGNPPWTEVSSPQVKQGEAAETKYVYPWMLQHASELPTGGNQVAELFCWKAVQHLKETDGFVGILIPAMTLFKDESKEFRRAFFRRCKVESVINFANLAYVLFAGRSEVPCAALLFRRRATGAEIDPGESIITYAPFLLNQEANRRGDGPRKTNTWTITVNGSEVREVATAEGAKGDALTWKLAMWGSYRDLQLLRSVAERFPTVLQAMSQRELLAVEGAGLRRVPDRKTVEAVPHAEERAGTELPEAHAGEVQFEKDLVGKKLLQPTLMPSTVRFTVPPGAFKIVREDEAYVRKRGGRLGLRVNEPPHIYVPSSRNCAVYSDEFFVIPPRQIGITGPKEQAGFLKALSLYFTSNFALYHQFLHSPQWGINENIANLRTLKGLPVPFAENSQEVVDELIELHTALVRWEERHDAVSRFAGTSDDDFLISYVPSTSERDELLGRVNDLVYQCLGLDAEERVLVDDLVEVRLKANKGKVAKEVVRPPTDEEIVAYATLLVRELDGFFEDSSDKRHQATVFVDSRSRSGLVEILTQQVSRKPLPPKVIPADKGVSDAVTELRKRVREERAQWLYFERVLRIYEGNRIYIMKPLQHIHWLRSQAVLDADSLLHDLVIQGA